MPGDNKGVIERLRAETAFERGRYFFNAGRFQDALVAQEDALRFDPSFTRAAAAKAITLAMLGKAFEGLALTDSIIAAEPAFFYGYMARAEALQQMGRTDEARFAFENALKLEPDDAALNYNYACFWAHCGDVAQCRRYLTRALEIDPKRNTHAAVDPDFAPFRDEEWFQELVAFRK
jgi:tetratricopeptide (TPR) repeat protein